jgi:hypothetical protein
MGVVKFMLSVPVHCQVPTNGSDEVAAAPLELLPQAAAPADASAVDKAKKKGTIGSLISFNSTGP